jgi:outer membrane protein OmpA-like peptidoglycan-associated protein
MNEDQVKGRMSHSVKFTVLLVTVLLLSACAANDPYMRTKTGVAIGAVAGGVLGHQLDSRHGRYYGAAAGAALGGGIGYAMDQQAQELEQIAMENQRLGMEVNRLQDGNIQVNFPSEMLFDFDRADIKSDVRPALDEVSRILNQEPRSRVTVVGHTDNVGSASYNMDLSQRRAQSVVGYLGSRGVDRQRLSAEGRGFHEPRASNATPEGRARNRRVELFIRPTA